MASNVAPLVANCGEIRLVRRRAAYAYGAWDVEWPEDFDAPQLEGGLRLGYVAKLDAKASPVASEIRFVQRDVSISAVEKTSDVEETLDSAESSASERVFFESEISGAGLAGQLPGVDFSLGDRVPVRVAGRVIPGNLVTNIRTTVADGALGVAVHVGGQLLRDDVARLKQNRDIERQIAQERREREKAVAGERAERREAIAQERSERIAADSDAAARLAAAQRQIGQDLTETVKKFEDSVASTNRAVDGVRVTANAAKRWTEDNQISFNLATALAFSAQAATNDFNSILWVKQAQWNSTQEKINSAQAQINESNRQWQQATDAWKRNKDALDARQNTQQRALQSVQNTQGAEIKRLDRVQQVQDTLLGMMARPLGAVAGPAGNPAVDEDKYGRLEVSVLGVTFTAKSTWTGKVYILTQHEAINNYTKLTVADITSAGQTVDMHKGFFQSVNSAIAFYKKI